jgi:signal transduction histidine kinase
VASLWNRYPRFGVRLKLLGGFVVIALFTALLGWYAVATMEQLNDGQRTVYRDVFGGTHLLASWIDASWESRRGILAYALSEDPAERAALRAKMAAGDVELEQLAARMDAVDTDRGEVDALARVVDRWHEYVDWRESALAAAEAANNPSLITAAYRANGAELDTALDSAIDSFLTSKREAGGQLEDSAQVRFEQTRRLAIGLSAIAAALALAVGLFLSRRIAHVARQVAGAAEGLARGELDQRIEVRSRDELGEMAESFRNMIAYQQEMARVANAIARGDLSQDVEPKSETDVLGTAFQHMSSNLRLLVGELQDALERSSDLLDQKEEYAATIKLQVTELSRLLEENGQLNDRLRCAAVRAAGLNEQALRRIGGDLHDGPGQALALALMRLEAVDGADVEGIRSVVQDALAELRSIASGLRLPELRDLSVANVVERAVRDHERRSGAPVRLSLSELPKEAAVSVKIALFRALQEALSNATRHGGGADVSVCAWVADEWLCLTVADRGPGFAAAHVERKGRLGLASMRERAELLGGRFQVESAPGRGTAVHLCWPLVIGPLALTDEGDLVHQAREMAAA